MYPNCYQIKIFTDSPHVKGHTFDFAHTCFTMEDSQLCIFYTKNASNNILQFYKVQPIISFWIFQK